MLLPRNITHDTKSNSRQFKTAILKQFTKSYAKLTAEHLGLTEEQQQIHDVAIDFAKQELSPNMIEWDLNETFPRRVLKHSADLGFGAIYTKPEHGGSGMSRLDASIIFEALSQGCTSTAAYLSIHNMVILLNVRLLG